MSLNISFKVPFKKCLVEDGTSNADAASDYSSTSKKFEVVSDTTVGVDISINQLTFIIAGSSAATNSSSFGNISKLTNGMTVKYNASSTDVYTLGTYKSLIDLDLVSDLHSEEVIGSDYIYEYKLKFDTPFLLKGGHTDSLYINLNDNFSGLTGLYFSVNGYTNTPQYSL